MMKTFFPFRHLHPKINFLIGPRPANCQLQVNFVNFAHFLTYSTGLLLVRAEMAGAVCYCCPSVCRSVGAYGNLWDWFQSTFWKSSFSLKAYDSEKFLNRHCPSLWILTYREFSPYANFITANFITVVFQNYY